MMIHKTHFKRTSPLNDRILQPEEQPSFAGWQDATLALFWLLFESHPFIFPNLQCI
jgi:hypothetical protein